MVNFQDIVSLKIDMEDIKTALRRALNLNFKDNLRDRSLLVALDSKIRGFLGEIAIQKYLEENNIIIEKGNTNVLNQNSNIDIDIKYKGKILEIKTSLIPRNFENLCNVIEKGDIKIIKRKKKIEDENINIHIQIYYNCIREDRDRFLEELEEKDKEEFKNQFNGLSLEDIITFMKLDSYIGKIFFVAWIDKETLIKNIHTLYTQNPTWKFGYKEFWTCKIKDCNPPKSLIDYLKGLE